MQQRSTQPDFTTAPDAELADALRAGSERAFEALMRRHNRMLFRAARSVLKDDAEAEDALQCAYLLAFRRIGSFRGEARLSTWLTRIVLNEAFGRLRSRRRAGVVIQLEDATDADGEVPQADPIDAERGQPETAAMRAQTRALIEKRIDCLPEQFRIVFVLRAVEELSVEETAACLGIPEATVRTRFFRARGLLRESLAREIDAAMDQAFAFAGSRCDRIVHAVLSRLRSSPFPPSG